jgi:excisionase family DNA binding protein
MGAIGDMQAYLQFQTARGIREAAQAGGEGMSGAGVGLGAGVGMGAAMAQMISQAAGGGGGQPSQAGAAPAAAGVPDIMTLSEAATYMRVGEDDVLSIINSGELKAKKIGTSYRIAKKAIDDYLAS